MKSIDKCRRSLCRSGLSSSLIFLFLSPFLCEAADINLERDLQESLEQSRTIVEMVESVLEAGGTGREDIARLKSRSAGVKSAYLLLQEKFHLREDMLRTGSAKAQDRHQAMTSNFRAALEEYLSLIDSLHPGNPSPAVLNNLRSLLDRILPKRAKPLLGALPYRVNDRHNGATDFRRNGASEKG